MQFAQSRAEVLYQHWSLLRWIPSAEPNHARLGRAMPRGETWALDEAQGRQVVCLEGTLWITQDTQSHDHVLEAGQRWRVPVHSPARVLVHALRDARVHVLALS